MSRNLSPLTNPAGLTAAISALYVLVTTIWHAASGHAAVDPSVIIAALSAFASVLTRLVVTPVADPKDRNGEPLVSAQRPGDHSAQ